MKRLFLLLILLILLGCSNNSDDVNNNLNVSEWSNQIDGIQVQLYTTKENYRVNENIELGIIINNLSDKSYTLNKSPYKTINMRHNGNAYADAIGEEKIAEEDIIIPPGEAKQLKIMIIPTNQGEGLYEFSGGMDGIKFPNIKIKVKK